MIYVFNPARYALIVFIEYFPCACLSFTKAESLLKKFFAYSDNNQPTLVSEQQGIWIQKLQKIVSDYTDTEQKEKFKSQLNIEVLDKTIFIYTPRGDIKELPVGSTVLDFAFSVHSSIGLRFKNAIVN